MIAREKISVTAGELARLSEGRLIGEESYVLEGAQGLAEAGPRDVSFLGNPKYTEAAASSAAGCLFLPASAKDMPAKAPAKIYVEDPQYAFSLVLGLIADKRARKPAVVDPRAVVDHAAKLSPGVGVGPFSVIERGAAVGQDTLIGAQCYIGENVRIGRGCRIYPQVVIREDCVVGDRAVIHSGTVIGADGFGFSTDTKTGRHRKIPQIGNVVIGEDVEIGANAAIDRATIGSTTIGAGTKIDNLVQIAHNVQVGRGCLLVSQVGVAGSSSLGDGVILAGQVGVAGHLKVGDRAIVMAQAGIMSDLEKGAIVFGYPARPRREAFRLQALYGRLPELFEAVKQIKEKMGLGGGLPTKPEE
ncbi:MAG TPA: UDP-3-O-(3-hydroxymyristoyl)glucosamine N-acyltransferase [Elusimicrobiota bacterium]|nr:UDP-3-O-(3-hydroxymyristoyl)glucosamine N-acyltransferase [Elusimicrobiota bacterium]